MRITETNLKKIITEEVNKIIEDGEYPTSEEVLEAFNLIASATPETLRENVQILEQLLVRVKNT